MKYFRLVAAYWDWTLMKYFRLVAACRDWTLIKYFSLVVAYNVNAGANSAWPFLAQEKSKPAAQRSISCIKNLHCSSHRSLFVVKAVQNAQFFSFHNILVLSLVTGDW